MVEQLWKNVLELGMLPGDDGTRLLCPAHPSELRTLGRVTYSDIWFSCILFDDAGANVKDLTFVVLIVCFCHIRGLEAMQFRHLGGDHAASCGCLRIEHWYDAKD